MRLLDQLIVLAAFFGGPTTLVLVIVVLRLDAWIAIVAALAVRHAAFAVNEAFPPR